MPLLQKARQNVWPTAVQLHTKLYGSKKELEKTDTFILQTGLSVQRRSRRRRRRPTLTQQPQGCQHSTGRQGREALRWCDAHAQSCHFHEVRGQVDDTDGWVDSGQWSACSAFRGFRPATALTSKVSLKFLCRWTGLTPSPSTMQQQSNINPYMQQNQICVLNVG